MRRLLLASLLVAACSTDFQPRSSVQKLRLLAVQAEPPEIGPTALGVPDGATLRSLVADPAQLADPASRAYVIHFACTPDPAPDPSLPLPADCTTYESLVSAAAFLDVQNSERRDCSAGIAPGCINAVGAEICTLEDGCTPVPGVAPRYTLPAQPLGFPGIYGEVVIVSLAVASDAADPEAALAEIPALVEDDPEQKRHMLSVKRISVRTERSTDPPNVNPSVTGILANGAPMDAGPAFGVGAQVELLARLPPGCGGVECPLRQPYTRYSDLGQPLDALTETWLYSWFATAGKMDRGRTLGEDETLTWFGPATEEGRAQPPAPGAAGDAAMMYLVVRDRRGGLDFTRAPFTLVP